MRKLQILLVLFGAFLCVYSIEPALTQDRKLIKLYGSVDQLATECANAGIQVTGNKFPLKIEKVRFGSPAYYGGVRSQDTVLSGKVENNRMFLVLRRDGRAYKIDLAVQPHSLQVNKQTGPLQAGTKETNLKESIQVFKDYDVVFVIDRSGSMAEPLQSLMTSKWEWCREQIVSFSGEVGSVLKDGFTIITFNDQYQVLRNGRASDVTNCFQNNCPSGNTDLGAPLAEALSQGSYGSKKLLVVVITDGLANRGRKPEDIIIEATKTMNKPSDIIVSFLEVGEKFSGLDLLKRLDNDLVSAGAKYDIVQVLPFNQLKAMGLTKALTSVVKGETLPATNR